MRFLISIMSIENPESKEAGISAVAFGILVVFSEIDWVTNPINLAAFIVGGSETGKIVCRGVGRIC